MLPAIVVDARGSLTAASALVAEHTTTTKGAPALVFVASAAPQLWGFARTARNEFPQLTVVAVDGDDALDDAELLAGDHVRRLCDAARVARPAAPRGGTEYRLQIDRPGQLQTLGFAAIDVEGLAPDEVRVKN
eukprot:gene46477-55394_t